MRCSSNNKKDSDLLKAADGKALIFLNDGTPTHSSFSYDTCDPLDIAVFSAKLYPFCKWSVLNDLSSDHLPIMITLKGYEHYLDPPEIYWNLKKANWNVFEQLTETALGSHPFGDNVEQEWEFFKSTIGHAAENPSPEVLLNALDRLCDSEMQPWPA